MSRRRKPSPQSLYVWEQLERISQAYHGASRHGQDPAEARAEWQRLWEETAAGDLTDYLSEPAGDEQALPALADLVEEFVNRLRRRVPRKKRLPDNATYADLLRLLDSTYPPSGRAAL